MSDFVAKNNACGQTILQIVSRGNAIIAEILRLKDYVPKIYRLETKADVQKYGEFIMNFSYFRIAEAQEQKIESNEAVRDLDEEFRDNHIEIISRFYLLFESIHTYISDLKDYLDEIEDGFFINQTLETIFADPEGKQLMCESLYLYGLMLLLVDYYIEGEIRERMLVSYYRYTPQRRDTQNCIDKICKLLGDTGFHTKKPPNYPEDYFNRIQINPTFVEMAIGRLRSDDIYNQITMYPLPKHRSIALSTQGAMLYVCLFFAPSILHSQTALLREIVDKYFPDNWVISIYMGFCVNLSESWENFKAAKMALNNTLELINIKNFANTHGSSVTTLLKKSSAILKEGNLSNEYILKEINNITSLLRECNVAIRWLMLHALNKPGNVDKNKKTKQLRELVCAEAKYDNITLFKLLLNTAQLELLTKEKLKETIDKKGEQFDFYKTESYKSMLELSEVFTGAKALSRVEKNEQLHLWFKEKAEEIQSLNLDEANSSRKIVILIRCLEQVQEFHQLDSNQQIVQYLQETRNFLHLMILTSNIKEDILITLQIVCDLSYAFELIDSFTTLMQVQIQKEPTLVKKLRAIFLKLSSALEIPLLRINQSQSNDLLSVSEYYSRELEIYVRKVLQIIPKMMFTKMAQIIHIQTSVLKELPTRLDKDKLKEFAQLDERFEFAKLTHSISVFSQGMRMMKTTLVGVICLDPKKLLEDGIRIELVNHLSKAFHDGLTFTPKTKTEEVEQKIRNLAKVIDGYKRSFEYIQDYISINGLKIWQEEVTRLISFNVEQECNGFLRTKIHAYESQYQNRYVPIPIFPRTDNISENFIGRLAREIIQITNPRTSFYVDQNTSWYDNKTQKIIFNLQTIELLMSALEVSGLIGLDRLFSFMIITNLEKAIAFLENKESKLNSHYNVLITLQKELTSKDTCFIPKFYQNCISKTTKVWIEFIDTLLIIGQLQLLRKLITFYLNMSCKFNAKNLEASLNSLSKCLLLDIKNEKFTPNEEIMELLTPYFDYAGLNNPYNKVYITSKINESFPNILFLCTISFLPKILLPNQNNLTRKLNDLIDGTTISMGIHTILKQFHHSLNHNFIELMSNYVINCSKFTISTKIGEPSIEAANGLTFLDCYTNFSDISRKSYKECIPEEILHLELGINNLNV